METESSRPSLDRSRLSNAAARKMASFHPEVVSDVERAVAEHPVVVVGMVGNPHVKNVRRALEAAGVTFHYLGYGGYLSKWRERLAIKLWSGWATFPQVFVNGVLIGGEDLTVAALADGTIARK
jgi:glutaredoxin-related protein